MSSNYGATHYDSVPMNVENYHPQQNNQYQQGQQQQFNHNLISLQQYPQQRHREQQSTEYERYNNPRKNNNIASDISLPRGPMTFFSSAKRPDEVNSNHNGGYNNSYNYTINNDKSPLRGMNRQLLHDIWPAMMEFCATFLVSLCAINFENNPNMIVFIYIGLLYACSSEAYYIQANPAVTLCFFLRGQITFMKSIEIIEVLQCN